MRDPPAVTAPRSPSLNSAQLLAPGRPPRPTTPGAHIAAPAGSNAGRSPHHRPRLPSFSTSPASGRRKSEYERRVENKPTRLGGTRHAVLLVSQHVISASDAARLDVRAWGLRQPTLSSPCQETPAGPRGRAPGSPRLSSKRPVRLLALPPAAAARPRLSWTRRRYKSGAGGGVGGS